MTTAERLARVLLTRHPDEAARLLDARPAEEVAALLDALDDPAGSALLVRLAPALAAAALASLADPRAARLLTVLPPHRVARLLRRASPERQAALLGRLPLPLGTGVRRLLAYERGTAGSLMDPLVFALPEDLEVGAALSALAEGRGAGPYVYGTDRDGKLTGVVALRQLLALDRTVALATVMARTVVRLRTRDDTRAVVVHPGWADYPALPVVDEAGILVGVLRYRTVRRLELEAAGAEAPVPLAAALAELYWLGLIGVTEGIASVVERAADKAREGAGG